VREIENIKSTFGESRKYFFFVKEPALNEYHPLTVLLITFYVPSRLDKKNRILISHCKNIAIKNEIILIGLVMYGF